MVPVEWELSVVLFWHSTGFKHDFDGLGHQKEDLEQNWIELVTNSWKSP